MTASNDDSDGRSLEQARADALLNQAAALQRIHFDGRYKEAIALADELIAKNPGYHLFHLLRGQSLMEMRDFHGAIESFRKVQELKPGEGKSIESLAWCLRKTGSGDDLLSMFAEMFYNHPNQGTATALLRIAFDQPEPDMELMQMLLHSFFPRHFKKYPGHEVVLSTCVPFEQWCIANGIPIDVIDPGGELYLTQTDGTPVPPYVAPAVRFATVPNARAIAGLDWVITPSGEFLDHSGLIPVANMIGQSIGGTTFVPFAPDQPRSRLLHARSKDEIFVDEDVLFLVAEQNHHFGHWVYDILSRLMGRQLPGKGALKLFTMASLPSPQRETLAQFGIRPDELIEAENGQAYRFRSATALLLGDTQRPTPYLGKFLHNGLAIAHTPLAAGKRGGRYFLERSQTKRGRDIVNRAALQSVLDKFGFETVRRPELTVAAQNEKFAEAEIILAPFGSDLVTYFQLRPGTDFVVLNFDDMENLYPGIEQIPVRYCAILGMHYHEVVCGLERRGNRIAYHGNMIVDCDALERVLAGIVKRRGTG